MIVSKTFNKLKEDEIIILKHQIVYNKYSGVLLRFGTQGHLDLAPGKIL